MGINTPNQHEGATQGVVELESSSTQNSVNVEIADEHVQCPQPTHTRARQELRRQINTAQFNHLSSDQAQQQEPRSNETSCLPFDPSIPQMRSSVSKSNRNFSLSSSGKFDNDEQLLCSNDSKEEHNEATQIIQISDDENVLSLSPRTPTSNPHHDRTRAVEEALGPLFWRDGLGGRAVLIGWGQAIHCQFMPVRIGHGADGSRFWHEIQEAYYRQRGKWRRYVWFYGVVSIQLIKARLQSPLNDEATIDRVYGGTYTDLSEEDEQICLTYMSMRNGRASLCEYFPEDDEGACGNTCTAVVPDDNIQDCLTRIQNSAQRHLACMDSMPTQRLLCFRNPERANKYSPKYYMSWIKPDMSNSSPTFEYLAQSDILHMPSLAEFEFEGFYLKEGWILDSTPVAVPIAATVIIMATLVVALVYGAKSVFGDWSTAWNVGSCVIAFITLAFMWLNHLLFT